MGHSSQSHGDYRPARRRRNKTRGEEDEDDNDSQGTETPGGEDEDEDVLDEVGAQDAFVAGMIYALSRKIMPGSPYTPTLASMNEIASTVNVAD